MFLHKGKEYYPLEIKQIIRKDNKVIYDREKRNKSYFYIVLNAQESE